MGASLLTLGTEGSFVLSQKTSIYGEQGPFSMVVDPTNGKARLYDITRDPLQRHDIAANHRAIASGLREQAERERKLIDYLLEANRVWPDSLVSGGSSSRKPAR